MGMALPGGEMTVRSCIECAVRGHCLLAGDYSDDRHNAVLTSNVRNCGDCLVKMLGVLLLAAIPVGLSAQTSEDAHVQHVHLSADAALNAQYRRTMAAMTLADRTRDER